MKKFLPIGWDSVSNSSIGTKGRIWTFWDPCALKLNVLVVDRQFMHCEITSMDEKFSFYATFVYAENMQVQRHHCWEALGNLQIPVDAPWSVLGDLNCMLELSYTWPTVYASRDDYEGLNDFLLRTNLSDLEYAGQRLTWTNSRTGSERVERKIDRVLVNEAWRDAMPMSKAYFDTFLFSDHSSVVVIISEGTHKKGFPFWFQELLV